MGIKTVSYKLIFDDKFHGILFKIDQELAQEAESSNCPYCDHQLHHADYPRSPNGIPANQRHHYEHRFSFCCSKRPSNNSLAIARSKVLVCISTKNASKIPLLYFIIICSTCRLMISCGQKIPHWSDRWAMVNDKRRFLYWIFSWSPKRSEYAWNRQCHFLYE